MGWRACACDPAADPSAAPASPVLRLVKYVNGGESPSQRLRWPVVRHLDGSLHRRSTLFIGAIAEADIQLGAALVLVQVLVASEFVEDLIEPTSLLLLAQTDVVAQNVSETHGVDAERVNVAITGMFGDIALDGVGL